MYKVIGGTRNLLDGNTNMHLLGRHVYFEKYVKDSTNHLDYSYY